MMLHLDLRISRVVLIFCLSAALFAANATAQQTYSLTDDDEWAATETIDPNTPAGELAAIRRKLAEGEFGEAESLADDWIEQHQRDPSAPEGYLARADAKRGAGEYYDALFDYEFVARVYPGSEAFVTALARELEIAKLFATGTKRKFWGMRILSAEDEAQELMIRVQERLPGSRLAEDAGIHLADFFFKRREMSLASEAYALFIENYPKSKHLPKARRRLIYANLAAFKGPEFDPKGLYEARSRLNTLEVTDPLTAEEIAADAILLRIDESDALKLLKTALWYERIGDPRSAEFTIRRLIRTYPTSVATTDALRAIPRILEKLPANIREEAPDYDAWREAILGAQRTASAEAGTADASP